MKNNETRDVFLGSSDRAEVMLVFFRKGGKETEVKFLHFGSDGSYTAHIVQSGEVADHYHEVIDLSNASWIEIYDDEEKNVGISGGAKFHRAGEFGCTIELCENSTVTSYTHVSPGVVDCRYV